MILTTFLSSMLLTVPADESCSSSRTAYDAAKTPPTIVEAALGTDAFSTLVTALEAADLVGALDQKGPFTVFAPTNDAFAQLPAHELQRLLKPENKHLLRSILTYHVVPGKLPAERVVASPFATTLNGQRIDFEVTDAGAAVDGARILQTDIQCANGIIHVIDRVILPSTSDLVATAVEAGSFETLAAALKAAGLVEALQGDGPFTVFAPTDEAFAALPEGTVADLLKPENREQLVAVLTYHVVPGRLYAGDVIEAHELKTLEGRHLGTKVRDGEVLVGSSRVVSADIETTNGVIHVIDRVLLPE